VYARIVEGIGSPLNGGYWLTVVVMVALFDPTVTVHRWVLWEPISYDLCRCSTIRRGTRSYRVLRKSGIREKLRSKPCSPSG